MSDNSDPINIQNSGTTEEVQPQQEDTTASQTAAEAEKKAASEKTAAETASGDAVANEATAVSADKVSQDAPVMRDKSESMRKEAKVLLGETNRMYKAGKKKIAPELAKRYEALAEQLRQSLRSEDGVDMEAYREVKKMASTTLHPFKKSSGREVFESLMFALVFALILRTFFIEPFKIPTRSMVPTLLEGDQLFVSKLSYGIRLPFLDRYIARFSEPQRGEVVVFAFPSDEAVEHLMRTNAQCMSPASAAGEKDYIKRIIGVEGDVIEVVEQTVLVNGSPIDSKPYYEHTVPRLFFVSDRRQGHWNHVRHGDATFTTMTHEVPNKHEGPFTVMPGHIFVMGDNRDNSLDSRCWGQVPVDNIKGRALFIWWSAGEHGPRWNRLFQTIL